MTITEVGQYNDESKGKKCLDYDTSEEFNQFYNDVLFHLNYYYLDNSKDLLHF